MDKINDLKEKLKKLSSIPGPSGHEELMVDFIMKEIKSLRLSPKVDNLGNVIVTIGKLNAKPSIMILAHMDEVGFVIRKIEDNGFIKFEKIGGIPEKVLAGSFLTIISNNDDLVEGVVGVKSHHLTPVSERYDVLPIDKCYMDIGSRSKKDVLDKGIDVGCVAVYSKKFIDNGPVVFTQALDNRAGCLTLLELLSDLKDRKIESQLSFVFSVQEEFNLRGVLPAARMLNPDLAIAVDAVITGDTLDLDKTDVGLGKGPGVSLYSFHGRGTLGGTIPNKKIRKFFDDVSAKHNIPFQKSVIYGGLTDASFLQLEKKGIPSIEVGYPIRYIHTPIECCNLQDIQELIKLLEFSINEIKLGIDFSFY